MNYFKSRHPEKLRERQQENINALIDKNVVYEDILSLKKWQEIDNYLQYDLDIYGAMMFNDNFKIKEVAMAIISATRKAIKQGLRAIGVNPYLDVAFYLHFEEKITADMQSELELLKSKVAGHCDFIT